MNIRTANNKTTARHAISPWALLLILAVSVALHAILFSLFTPLPPVPHRDSDFTQNFTGILEESSITPQNDPYGLCYWLRYTDPIKTVNPAPGKRFSRLLSFQNQKKPDPQTFEHQLFQASAQYKIPYLETTIPVRHSSSFQTGLKEPALYYPRKNTAMTPVAYPYLSDAQGNIIQTGLFRDDEKILRMIQRKVPSVSKPTLLEMRGSIEKLDYEITVRQSCGSPELDMLAKRQLIMLQLPENTVAAPVKSYKIFWGPWKTTVPGKEKKR